MNDYKSETMELKGFSPYCSETLAAFLVADKNGKTYTVRIPLTCEETASSSKPAARFRCNCARNLICGGVCTHMRYICLQALGMSEDQLNDLKNGQELEKKYLEKAQLRVTQELDLKSTAANVRNEVRLVNRTNTPSAKEITVPATPERAAPEISPHQLNHVRKCERTQPRSHSTLTPYTHQRAIAMNCQSADPNHLRTSKYSSGELDAPRTCDPHRPRRRDRLKSCVTLIRNNTLSSIARVQTRCAHFTIIAILTTRLLAMSGFQVARATSK